VEAAEVGGLANDVAFHGLHQLVAGRRRRQLELRVERVELKDIVMERSHARTGPEVRRRVVTASADARAWHVVVNGGESILEALDLEARYQISSWDALVLHAAQAAGAEVLDSEDLSDGQTYGSVRVANLLRASG
jgi:predicted nucleic acid-binding protein